MARGVRAAALFLAALQSVPMHPLEGQGQAQVVPVGRCQLAGGGTISDCRVAYRSFGQLNAARSNGVLIPTWLLGRSEDWISFLGPRGYVDTTQLYVIVVDALGNGRSSSPSTVPTQERPAFRGLTIGDMVVSQHRLLTEHLGISHLHAVVGFSMGGMQALEWAVRFPTFLDMAVPIAGTPRIGAFDRLMWTTMLAEIEAATRSHATVAAELASSRFCVGPACTAGGALPQDPCGGERTWLGQRAHRGSRAGESLSSDLDAGGLRGTTASDSSARHLAWLQLRVVASRESRARESVHRSFP